MSPAFQQVVISKWLPILQEYDLVKARRSAHFRTVKALLSAFHVHKRDLYKYHARWMAAGRHPQALLPHKRGPRVRTRRTPKPIERAFIKAYRHLGCPSYELVLLFKPYYGTATPSPRTVDRIKARYPLNPAQKARIKRYEKRYPGELGHLDGYYLPRALASPRHYLLALEDDCTRLAYAEVVPSLQAQPVSFFVARALSWFLQVYGFRFDAVLTDNGGEFKGRGEHPVEALLAQLGVAHWHTAPYRPQANGKVEAFFKIVQTELIRAHHFTGLDEFTEQLGAYLFEYNHSRRHGGIGYETPFEKLQRVTELLT